MRFVLVARFVLTVRPDKRGEFLSAVAGIIDRTLALPGCLCCRLSSDCQDTDSYFLTSEWQGEAEYNAFGNSRELQILCGMRMLLSTDPRAIVDDVRRRTEGPLLAPAIDQSRHL
jgi:quinol monooxygenase YgiN